MNGSEFIDFASRLSLQTSGGSAGFRSATSRAYYGAFHVARDFLNAQNFHCPSGDNEHQWVQRHFLNCTMLDAIEIGRGLQNLHSSRKAADYDLHKTPPDSQSNAVVCVKRADKIRDLVKKLATPELYSTVQAEMQTYRRKVNL